MSRPRSPDAPVLTASADLPPLPRPRPRPSPRARPADPATAPDGPAAGAGGSGRTDPVAPEDDTAVVTAPEDEARPTEPDGEEQVAVWQLVADAQAGRAEAFGELYARYANMVFRYLYHRVPDRQTAEDFTSETFVRALRRIDSLSFQGRDVGAWLVTIARNIVRDHVKSSRFRLEVATADMRDADRATDGPEDAVLQGLTNAELMACVAQLGDEQRECISLRFLQGLSVAETAAAMGKKDGAIKALQHRAVRKLATLVGDTL